MSSGGYGRRELATGRKPRIRTKDRGPKGAPPTLVPHRPPSCEHGIVGACPWCHPKNC